MEITDDSTAMFEQMELADEVQQRFFRMLGAIANQSKIEVTSLEVAALAALLVANARDCGDETRWTVLVADDGSARGSEFFPSQKPSEQ